MISESYFCRVTEESAMPRRLAPARPSSSFTSHAGSQKPTSASPSSCIGKSSSTRLCKALAAEGLAYGIIAAGYPENASASVLVGMAQTFAHRSGRLDDVHFVIVDEAHHVVAATWRAILEQVPHARVLGVTATPERLDGKGLREAFDALMIGPTVKELIAGGWLVAVRRLCAGTSGRSRRAPAPSPETMRSATWHGA